MPINGEGLYASITSTSWSYSIFVPFQNTDGSTEIIDSVVR